MTCTRPVAPPSVEALAAIHACAPRYSWALPAPASSTCSTPNSVTENGSPFDLAYASRASNMEAIDFWRAVYSFE